MKEQLGLHFLPDQSCTLDNFIPGQNLEVYEQLLRLEPGRLIYLFGPRGTGKTHLLQALAARHGGMMAADRLARTVAEPFFLDRLGEHPPPLIAVDDLHNLTDFQLNELFNLLNYWHGLRHTADAFTLVIAGNLPPRQLKIREDLRNRLGWDLAYSLKPLSEEDILLAIEVRAFDRGLKISKEASRWLVTHAERHIPALYAWLDALDLYSLAKRRRITLPLIKQFMQQHPSHIPETDYD